MVIGLFSFDIASPTQRKWDSLPLSRVNDTGTGEAWQEDTWEDIYKQDKKDPIRSNQINFPSMPSIMTRQYMNSQ
jgi:hypothetical protein